MAKKKASAKRRPTDINQLAHYLAEAATKGSSTVVFGKEPSKDEVSRVTSALGRKFGRKSRADASTKEHRRHRREEILATCRT